VTDSAPRVTVSPARPVRAGEPNTLTFTLQAGTRGIGRGGGLEIVFRSDKTEVMWSVPQSADPTAPGYTTASAPAGVELRLAVNPMPPFAELFSFRFHVVSCYVTSGELRAGEELRVTFGDTVGGSYGALAPIVAIQSRFPVLVYTGTSRRISEFYSRDYRAMGHRALKSYDLCDHLLTLAPEAGRPHRLFPVVPTIIGRGNPARVRAVALDAYANHARYDSGAVDILLLDGRLHVRRELGRAKLRDGTADFHFEPPTPGIYYLRLEDRHLGLWGLSNPFRVTRAGELPVFWGDPHCHSLLSDGTTSSKEHYHYAREVALLDFASVTDHGPLSTERWDETCRWADSFNRPGEFVALLGHERAFREDSGSSVHANYYYLTHESLAEVPTPVSGVKSPEFLGRLAKLRGIVVPHHTAYAVESMGLSDWSLFDDVPVTTCEVYSTHGNSESYHGPRPIHGRREGIYYQDALRRGLKLGAIAGSDHHGVPCGSLLKLQHYPKNSTDEHMAFRGGLSAVRGCSLSRAGLFAAIVDRRTYATSGDRVLLDFTVSGHPMGSIVEGARPGRRRISLLVAGTATLGRIEVLQNEEVLAAFEPEGFVFRTSLTDNRAGRRPSEWYRLRVVQADGELAWSSPIWFQYMR